ncbi:MAG TPA: response regulator [Bdellovibrionota bacterium]|nr:response regulator [Bdellovibrionota bacterium]
MASILLIEDDHDTRVTLRQNLEAEGHFVYTSTNGRDGLDALKRLDPSPSLIVIDLMMPIMGGDEFVRRIRTVPAFARIPIIAMSAHRDPAIEGVTGYLCKPFDLENLLAAIETGLQPRSPEQQQSLFVPYY